MNWSYRCSNVRFWMQKNIVCEQPYWYVYQNTLISKTWCMYSDATRWNWTVLMWYKYWKIQSRKFYNNESTDQVNIHIVKLNCKWPLDDFWPLTQKTPNFAGYYFDIKWNHRIHQWCNIEFIVYMMI